MSIFTSDRDKEILKSDIESTVENKDIILKALNL